MEVALGPSTLVSHQDRSCTHERASLHRVRSIRPIVQLVQLDPELAECRQDYRGRCQFVSLDNALLNCSRTDSSAYLCRMRISICSRLSASKILLGIFI